MVSAEVGEVVVQASTYLKVSYPLQRSHTADNTTSCDAFLCDVKLAASGLRGTADVRERDKDRDNKEGKGENRSYG